VAVTPTEQAEIQRFVDTCNPRELVALHGDMTDNIRRLSRIARHRLVTGEELKDANVALEFLTRVEAKQLGRGWWFRRRRRFQLGKMYFGPRGGSYI
jgi:hypothetical protein